MAQISYGTITITDITDIESIKNWYLATNSSSGVTKNTSGWTTTIQQMDASKQYLWNYEQILGTDNIEISSTDPIIIGHFGTNGQNGADGNSITSIDEYYKITNSTSNPGSSGWTKNSLVVPTNENRYLWNYQVINYSKTSAEGSYSDARIIGIYGDTGQRGTSILKVTTAPTSTSGTAGGFSYSYRMPLSTVKTQSGKSEVLIGDIVEYNSNHYSVGYVNSSYVYLSAATSIKGADGQTYYTHILYSSKASPTSSSDVSSSPTGKSYVGIQTTTSSTAPAWNDSGWVWMKYIGTDGGQGPQGVSVTGVKEIYYLKTSSGSVPTAPADGTDITSTSTSTGVWTTAVPDYVAGAQYYTSIQTSFSSGTSPISSPARVNQGLTAANQKALDAYNTSVARDTEINALQAQATHYWWDSSGAHVAAGQNTTSVDNLTQGQPDTYAFNALMAPGFLKLKYKNIDFVQLATNSLTFYRPAVNNSTYVQGKKAMVLDADALTFYKPLAYNSANEPTAAATLNANGLVLAEGGIIAGTKGQAGYVYLSSTDHPIGNDGITINGYTPDNNNNTERWREVIGTKFGVTNAGTLYASNAVISGNIAATNGFTVTSAAVNGVTLASMTGSGITVGQIGSDNFNILITDSAVNDRGPGILLRKGLTVLSVFGQVTTNNITSNGLHVYEPGSGILLGKFTGNEVEFGNPAINRFVMNSEGLTISNTLGASIGTIRLSVARGDGTTDVQLVNNDYNLANSTTNRSVERDGNIDTSWVISTPYVYSDSIGNINSVTVTFKTYQLQNANETSYSCTLDSKLGNIIKGSAINHSDIEAEYDTSTGIISITIPKSVYHKEQVFDESYCSELEINASGNVKYGNTSKTTTISLSETPIGTTTFSVNIPWLGEDVWTSCTAGTAWSQSIAIDDYGIEDGNDLYLVKGTIFYNGTAFIFNLNAAFTRSTTIVIDDDTGEVTETEVDTTVSFSEKTVPIIINVKDMHAYGFYVKTANVIINSPASKGNYLFGTTRLVNNEDITRTKQNVMTVGTGLVANFNNQLVIGQYNATDKEDAAFIVGTGTASAPRNSFIIWKDGNIGFGNSGDKIEFYARTKNLSEAFIRIFDTGADYGHNLILKSGGAMIVGGGESPQYIYDNNIDYAKQTTENLYLTADNVVMVYTNANTIGNRKRFGFWSDGSFEIPGSSILIDGNVSTKKKPTIVAYNNGTTNYGCLGFRAAGQKKPYFAFWTNEKDAGDVGRFYIAQEKIYTANGTPFQSTGNLIVDKNTTLRGTLSVAKAATLSSTLTINGAVYIPNNNSIYGKTTGGSWLNALAPCNSSNSCVLGWGGYDNSIGQTGIYGNALYLNSKGTISANQPLRVGGYKIITTEEHSIDNVTINANDYKEGSFSVSKTGYSAIGALEAYAVNASSSGSGSSRAMMYQAFINQGSNTFSYGIRNTYSSAIKIKIIVRVLYVSSTQGL